MAPARRLPLAPPAEAPRRRLPLADEARPADRRARPLNAVWELRGGCSWTAHSLFGKRGNNPFCHHRALDLLRRDKRERVVQVEPAAGAPFDHGRFEVIEESLPAAERAAREKLWQEPKSGLSTEERTAR